MRKILAEWIKRKHDLNFPGGTMDKNPPANAGDTGSIPGPRKILYAVEQLNPCTTTTEPEIQSPGASTTEAPRLEPGTHNKRRHHNEKPLHHNKE